MTTSLDDTKLFTVAKAVNEQEKLKKNDCVQITDWTVKYSNEFSSGIHKVSQ